jgi:hypothetical protein
MTRTYYGAPIPRSTGPHPDPLTEAPIAEDWENACHEVIWKKDPELFSRIQEQAVLERQERIAKAASSFPQPAWNPGGKPCGECHLRDGETCDICGAVEPLDPDRLREDRDERRRMERENPYAE